MYKKILKIDEKQLLFKGNHELLFHFNRKLEDKPTSILEVENGCMTQFVYHAGSLIQNPLFPISLPLLQKQIHMLAQLCRFDKESIPDHITATLFEKIDSESHLLNELPLRKYLDLLISLAVLASKHKSLSLFMEEYLAEFEARTLQGSFDGLEEWRLLSTTRLMIEAVEVYYAITREKRVFVELLHKSLEYFGSYLDFSFKVNSELSSDVMVEIVLSFAKHKMLLDRHVLTKLIDQLKRSKARSSVGVREAVCKLY